MRRALWDGFSSARFLVHEPEERMKDALSESGMHPPTTRQRDLRAFDEETAVEGESECVDLHATFFYVRNEDTCS
jgi:hypothetical protein